MREFGFNKRPQYLTGKQLAWFFGLCAGICGLVFGAYLFFGWILDQVGL